MQEFRKVPDDGGLSGTPGYMALLPSSLFKVLGVGGHRANALVLANVGGHKPEMGALSVITSIMREKGGNKW